MTTIRENLESVREAMSLACQRSGRKESDVTLIAVTKFVEIARIREAVDAGVTEIGENRAQEFTEKLNFYKQNQLRAHFIGQLQTNKVKYVCGKADLIQSVDREPLLDAIRAYAERNGVTQDILIEVNIGREAQKGGISPEALPALLDRIAGQNNVRLRGLMCVPPAIEKEAVRPYFREMRMLFERVQRTYPDLSIDTLSMGMSHDFDTAIEEGATTVRVGTAIFGPRTTTGGKQNG
ncbi:MAG: YggS family pyridoxal phosphate-dependent enzyme [Clostridia bacterium]|nr:YggS family pyridoxal phosphate-dependent enzyme [Clostridia bacterium]